MALWHVVQPRGGSVPPETLPPCDGRNPLPWGYPTTWGTPPTPPVPSSRHSFKRARSETDDCEDAYSEESSKEQYVKISFTLYSVI